jgi:hypothetical protein
MTGAIQNAPVLPKPGTESDPYMTRSLTHDRHRP